MSQMVQETTRIETATQPQRVPRHRLQGGFLISSDTAIEWASRIVGKPITKDHMNYVWQVIDKRVKPKGALFSLIGEVPYEQFLVATRRVHFQGGYVGMDASKIPQFEEGQREAIARKLLEEEGIENPVFVTVLG